MRPNQHIYDHTIDAETGEVTEKLTIYCGDCMKDITGQKSHECKEQRAANRRAEIKARAERGKR